MAESRLDAHVWRVAAVFILGTVMSVLDTTIVNVALRDIALDLDATIKQIQWITTGYLLAIAAVIPVAAWATRRFGTRNIYIGSLLLFTAGSLLCALAWSVNSLIAFRVIQGIGGGLLMPVGQMILIRAAGPANLGRVMGAVGIPILLAPVLGPTLGGFLLQVASWHWIFLINVPVGAIAVTAAIRLLPPNETGDAGRLDFIGLGLAMGGAVGLTYGLAEGASAGNMTSPRGVIPAVAGITMLVLFVIRALRVPNPLLDVRLFKQRMYASGAATTFAVGAMLFGGMILMPLYLQTVRGLEPLDTGILLAPQGIGAAFAMITTGRLSDRIGSGVIALCGTVVTVVTTVPFALFTAHTPYWVIEVSMLLRGLGIGMTMLPAMTAAYRKLEPLKINDATAQLTVLQRIGGSLGTAILSVSLQSHLPVIPSPDGAAGAFRHTYLLVLGLGVATLIPVGFLAWAERKDRVQPGRPQPEIVPSATDIAMDIGA